MTRLALLAVVLAGAAILALGLRPGAPARADGPTVVMRVGDTMQVEGAPIGCQVVKRGDRAVLDCRRGGRLAGTYGTLLDERRARVARFRSSDTAEVVFTARHRGKARRCEERGRTRSAANRREKRGGTP
jgi:hypothetical protein